jgi:FkbM family methyltransferase
MTFSSARALIGRLARGRDPAGTQIATILRHFAVSVVLDVGANVGQYARSLRGAGYRMKIVSFEPLSEAHRMLSAAARHDPNWIVHPRCALGSAAGEVDINIAANSVSSSIMPMLPAHAAAAPQSKFIAQERVSVTTVDSLFARYCSPADKVCLKIDAQGFEKQVLDGAVESRRAIALIQLEVSLLHLYEGEELWDYFLSRMQAEGYALWAFIPGFWDLRTGQSLQLDAIFART